MRPLLPLRPYALTSLFGEGGFGALAIDRKRTPKSVGDRLFLRAYSICIYLGRAEPRMTQPLLEEIDRDARLQNAHSKSVAYTFRHCLLAGDAGFVHAGLDVPPRSGSTPFPNPIRARIGLSLTDAVRFVDFGKKCWRQRYSSKHAAPPLFERLNDHDPGREVDLARR